MPSIEYAKHADEFRARYTYFVLAASASVIGYSFNIAATSKVSLQLLLFVPVIITFGLSFYFGLKSIKSHLSVSNSYANIENLDNAIESSSKFLSQEEQKSFHKMHLGTLMANIEMIKKDGNATTYYLNKQYFFLLWGGVSFVVWQSTELTLRVILWFKLTG